MGFWIAAKKSAATSADSLSEYDRAKALAAEIAARDNGSEDAVFADAMHVAVALALAAEDRPYTKRNVAWMFDRVSPQEVHDVLQLRSEEPEEYAMLPKAGKIERLSAADLDAAIALAGDLTREQIDAFFFSDDAGNV